MPNVLKFTPEMQEAYLELLRAGQTLTGAAEVLKLSYWTILMHRRRHKKYNARCYDAMMVSVHMIADDLYLKAHSGDFESIRFFLINRTKHFKELEEQWHNINRTELTGKDGGAIQVNTIMDLVKEADEIQRASKAKLPAAKPG